MDDGDGRAISTSSRKKTLGPNVADYAALTPEFEASHEEAAILFENGNQKSSELNEQSRKN